jgi:transposase
MATQILLPNDFLNYDFVAMARKEANSKNRMRLIAMANIKDGKTLTQIADSLKIHWKTIQVWLAQFRKGGINALYVKTTKNKPKKLNDAIEIWVAEFINNLNSKETGGYTTGKQIHALIEQKFSIKCCLRSVYNLLHRLNFSWITARSKHSKSDPEAQELYKKLSKSSKRATA